MARAPAAWRRVLAACGVAALFGVLSPSCGGDRDPVVGSCLSVMDYLCVEYRGAEDEASRLAARTHCYTVTLSAPRYRPAERCPQGATVRCDGELSSVAGGDAHVELRTLWYFPGAVCAGDGEPERDASMGLSDADAG